MKSVSVPKWLSWGAVGGSLMLALALALGPGCDGVGDDSGWGDYEDVDKWETEDPVDRGASDNDRQSGRQDRGQDPGSGKVVEEQDPETEETIWTYSLNYQDLILAPDGNNLLVNVPKPGPNAGFEAPGMVLAVQPLPLGSAHFLPQLQDVRRVNFSPEGDFAYLVSSDGLSVSELDLREYIITAKYTLPSAYSVVDVTPNGRYLLASNLPTSAQAKEDYNPYLSTCGVAVSGTGLAASASYCKLGLVDRQTGAVWEVEMPRRIQDLDVDPNKGSVLISYSIREGGEDGSTQSYLLFYNPEAGNVTAKLQFENCADEVVISSTAKMALQSPTACTQPASFDPQDPVSDKEGTWSGQQAFKDPISVIDLAAREFITNLPGFGPVAITRDGSMVAGFTLREVMVDEWGYDDQVDLVGIIFVNLPSLDWVVVDAGSAVPAYTFSPDGQFLYLYDDNPFGESRLGRINTSTYELTWLDGPTIDLDGFVWTPSGKSMFTVSDDKLFRVRHDSGSIDSVSIPVQADLINIRPQGDFILVGPDHAPEFHLLPVPEEEMDIEVADDFNLEIPGME